MLEDVVRKGRLLDLYGPLLTEKQRRCMEMYFEMDLSLTEIGEELGISQVQVSRMEKKILKTMREHAKE